MFSMLAKRIESKCQYVWTGPFVMFNFQVNLGTIITTKEFLPCRERKFERFQVVERSCEINRRLPD